VEVEGGLLIEGGCRGSISILRQISDANSLLQRAHHHHQQQQQQQELTVNAIMAELASMDNNNQQQTKKVKGKIAEPKITWRKSKAKSLIYKDTMEGTRVLLEAKHENGELTMPLLDVYTRQPGLAKYHYSKFSRRLGYLRKTIAELMDRKKEDQQDFVAYVSNHPASSFSHHGYMYIQYQGSEAQELLKQDIEEKLHETMGKKELWLFRSEYNLNFPLSCFPGQDLSRNRNCKVSTYLQGES
jgi:hypothetical protein